MPGPDAFCMKIPARSSALDLIGRAGHVGLSRSVYVPRFARRGLQSPRDVR
jgi:hypothetical protein